MVTLSGSCGSEGCKVIMISLECRSCGKMIEGRAFKRCLRKFYTCPHCLRRECYHVNKEPENLQPTEGVVEWLTI